MITWAGVTVICLAIATCISSLGSAYYVVKTFDNSVLYFVLRNQYIVCGGSWTIGMISLWSGTEHQIPCTVGSTFALYTYYSFITSNCLVTIFR